MAKLIVLALAFTALVGFASAYTTIVTNTYDGENPYSTQQCQQQIQGQRLNQCQAYLQQGLGFFEDIWGQPEQGLQQCCNELQRVDQQCQCDAVTDVYQKAQQIEAQQGGIFGGILGSQKIQKLKQKAQNLPNKCNLRQQCQIPNLVSTTTTTVIEHNPSQDPQQYCSQKIQGQRFQQCQSYIQQAQQSGSYGSLLMSTNKQGTQFQQQLKQCCNELHNVETDCQCEAMKQLYNQAKQQQQRWSQQGSSRGGQQQQQMQGVRSIVENLRDQCNLQVKQCRIPSAMF